MKIEFRFNPRAVETTPLMEGLERTKETAVSLIIDMHRSIYDEAEPLQDTDANGNKLWFDPLTDMIYPEPDALLLMQPGPGVTRLVLQRKYRARTDLEMVQLLTERTVRGWWATARARRRFLAQQAIIDESDVDLPLE